MPRGSQVPGCQQRWSELFSFMKLPWGFLGMSLRPRAGQSAALGELDTWPQRTGQNVTTPVGPRQGDRQPGAPPQPSDVAALLTDTGFHRVGSHSKADHLLKGNRVCGHVTVFFSAGLLTNSFRFSVATGSQTPGWEHRERLPVSTACAQEQGLRPQKEPVPVPMNSTGWAGPRLSASSQGLREAGLFPGPGGPPLPPPPFPPRRIPGGVS